MMCRTGFATPSGSLSLMHMGCDRRVKPQAAFTDPHVSSIDWKTTIHRNLKHYSHEHGKLIPERFYFFGRTQSSNNWTVIVDMDQSGSMADSVLHTSRMASIGRLTLEGREE